jgi:hypothetical protein
VLAWRRSRVAVAIGRSIDKTICAVRTIDLEPAVSLLHDAMMGESLESEALRRPVVAARHRGVRPVFLLALALALSVWVLVVPRGRGVDDDGVRRGERGSWFAENKAHCNPLEVNSFLAAHAPAPTVEVTAQRAACLAIAGKIAAARALIAGLSPGRRDDAVNNLFLIAHPVADAGDDESAGPIMELVLEFQPDQYMALYHAGMAMAITGDDDKARRYLNRFLTLYLNQDIWNRSAHRALDALDRPPAERTIEKGSEGSYVY